MGERHHCGRHNLLHDGEYCPKCLGDYESPVQNVLNMMRAAFEDGRGIRVSAYELQCLSVTLLGQMWDEDDPRGANL